MAFVPAAQFPGRPAGARVQVEEVAADGVLTCRMQKQRAALGFLSARLAIWTLGCTPLYERR